MSLCRNGLLLVLLLLLGGGLAGAEAPGELHITGQATLEFAPEQAELLARIDKRAASPDAAAAAAAAVVTPLIERLRALGLEPAQIQAVGTRVAPVHEWDQKNRRQVLVGYQALRELRLARLELERLGPVMQLLAEAGVEQIESPQLRLADPDGAREASLRAAAADARRQALALAQTLGVTLGRPLRIDADPQAAAPPPVAFKMARAEAADVAGSYDNPGLIEISARVRVVFALR